MSGPLSAFYLPRGDGFEATLATRGPWSNDHQHAGPPSALMVRALEHAASERGGFRLVRVLVELYKPIPIATVTLETSQPVPGSRVIRLEASLLCRGQELARARGLFMRSATLDLPENARAPRISPPALDVAPCVTFPFFMDEVGYHTAMELRLTSGGFGCAASGAWMRQRVPVVEDEAPSPAQRTLVVADSGNGITNVLDKRRFTFANADLIVSFVREPTGEWIHMDARTEPDPGGSGLTHTVLSDASGAFGRGVQSLFLSDV